MGLSLHPARLKRYKDVARLRFKYGRTDLVARAGLDAALEGEELPSGAGAPAPKELAADLERLGPAFIKLGQLLSTRADLLSPAYLEALSRLQDSVEPFSFADVERVIQEDFGFRLSKGFATFEAARACRRPTSLRPRSKRRSSWSSFPGASTGCSTPSRTTS